MAASRTRKPAGKTAKPAARKPQAKTHGSVAKVAKPLKAARKVAVRAAKPAAKPARKKPIVVATNKSAVGAKAGSGAKPATPSKPSGSARPASVRTAARAVAAARAGAIKRRAPSYIPRSSFNDDWMMTGMVELPRGPRPAAHTPTRKPPKPRAPKPKAISHEQAVANLKALLESRKRKDRSGAVAKSA